MQKGGISKMDEEIKKEYESGMSIGQICEKHKYQMSMCTVFFTNA